MMKVLILVSMIFLHIIDDFHLQGILANMKQQEWWRSQPAYTSLYKNDYIVCLFIHAFQWSFTMMIPLGAYCYTINAFNLSLLIAFVVNTILHAVVDNLKANRLVINLVQDQAFHLLQIVVTWVVILWKV